MEGVKTNKEHWKKLVLIHQVSLCKFQRNSNLVWNINCGGRNTEDALCTGKYKKNQVDVFKSQF